MKPLRGVLLALALCLVAVPAAHADRSIVSSFDGTPIVVNFFAAEGLGTGERAPTIIVGPGFSFPGETDPDSGSSDLAGDVGLGPLRRAGYNVVTFDPRGFGASGGEAQIDSPAFEARDVGAIIDQLATRPQAELDAPGDPVVGMSGGSYGGAIQFVTAAVDDRVDAIAPSIAWHSLVTSLFKAADLKAGWGAALCGLGLANGTAGGLVSPAGLQAGSVDEVVRRTCTEGLATGRVRPADVAWFRDRGPAGLLARIDAPTLIVQGTADTLFTLQEAIDNHGELARTTDVPLRMMWFCGGHGACLTGGGPAGHVERRVIAWMDRWLKDDRAAEVGPHFEWLADDARWRSADHFPLVRAGALRGSGSGLLPLSAAGSSGALTLATPVALGALNVPIEAAGEADDLLGAPALRMTYSGTAAPASTHVYAQIVDEQRRVVVGNQITPVPVTLDGRRRTVELPLEPIAARARAGDRYRLQLVPSSTVYYPQSALGALRVRSARVELPVVDPALRPRPDLRLTRRCLRDGRLRMTIRGEDVDRVRDVNFKFARRLVRRDEAAPFERLAPRRTLARTRATTLRAVVYLRDRPPAERVILARTLPRCGQR